MLEVLRDNPIQCEMLGIGPEIGVRPRQLVGRATAQGESQHSLVRVENLKLRQQFLGFAARIAQLENRRGVTATAGGRCEKLYDRLVWGAKGALGDSLAQQRFRNGLLFREPRVESIYKNIGINEREHSSLVQRCARPAAIVRGNGRSVARPMLLALRRKVEQDELIGD